MAIVPLQFSRDRTAIEAHFAALGPRDLRLRFGETVRPEMLVAYLDSVEARNEPMFGIVNHDLLIVAIGQFSASADGLEVGLSVLPRYRRRGLGTALLDRAATYARARGITILVMHCLSENAPAVAMARRYGMSIVGSGAETDGRLELRAGTSIDRETDAAYDQAGALDFTVKQWQLALRTRT